MMFRVAFCLLLLLSSAPWPLWSVILDEKGEVLSDVVAIFHKLEPVMSEQQRALLHPPTLESLNSLAQQVFLRSAGLERKDIRQKDSLFAPYANAQMLHHFKAIGDIGPALPSHQEYAYILFNGATVQNMRQRLADLIELVENGSLHITPSTQLVLLTGERDLFESESREILLDASPLTQDPSWRPTEPWPLTEADALVWIFQQTLLPPTLSGAKLVVVRAPKNQKIDSDGHITYTRPTTQDTVKTWIEQCHPLPGRCLSISFQPFAYYQGVAMRSCLASLGIKGFEVDVSGPDRMKSERFDENIHIYLDNLARTIYCERQLLLCKK